VLADGTIVSFDMIGGSGTAGGAKDPTIAASPSRALAVWVDDLSLPTDLHARLLGATAPSSGVFSLSDAPEHQERPDATWNGTEFVVAWQDERNKVAFFDPRRDIFAARVADSGTPTVLDPAGFAVAAAPTFELHPTVAARPGTTLFGLCLFTSMFRAGVARLGAWTDLGFGLAGARGAPVLVMSGQLVAGSTVGFHLEKAATVAPATHVLGASRLQLPLFGGTLLPAPDLALPFVTSATGQTLMTVPVPFTAPTGVELFSQAWIVDPSGPAGFTASNAMQYTAR
jgi:hypothetical protein